MTTPHTTRRAQMQRIQTDLHRIVGLRGTEALLERSRALCGRRAPSLPLQLSKLLQLIRKYLGEPLARWLLQPPALRIG